MVQSLKNALELGQTLQRRTDVRLNACHVHVARFELQRHAVSPLCDWTARAAWCARVAGSASGQTTRPVPAVQWLRMWQAGTGGHDAWQAAQMPFQLCKAACHAVVGEWYGQTLQVCNLCLVCRGSYQCTTVALVLAQPQPLV